MRLKQLIKETEEARRRRHRVLRGELCALCDREIGPETEALTLCDECYEELKAV